jgi:hypothetical protein
MKGTTKIKVQSTRDETRNGQSKPRRLPCALCAVLITVFCGLNTSFSQTNDFSNVRTKLDLGTKLIQGSHDSNSSDQKVEKRKSPGLAVLASLMVPGLGELYAGRYDAGKYSTIAEVSLWVFYTILEVHSDQVRSDAINYARIYSGAQVSGKPDDFFVNIGNFPNTQDYNNQKIQNGNYDLIYNSSSYEWQWQSDADRAEFKSLRIEADQFLNYGRYTAAVIVLNHLLSAINAARLVAGVNASAATSFGDSPQPLSQAMPSTGVYLKLSAGF